MPLLWISSPPVHSPRSRTLVTYYMSLDRPEQNMYNAPMATLLDTPPPPATDEPAVPPASPPLAAPPVAPALDAAHRAAVEAHSVRAPRRDGWTPERVTLFLTALAQCGSVEHAARAAGMTKQGAYALRSRAGGRAFALAWDAA